MKEVESHRTEERSTAWKGWKEEGEEGRSDGKGERGGRERGGQCIKINKNIIEEKNKEERKNERN